LDAGSDQRCEKIVTQDGSNGIKPENVGKKNKGGWVPKFGCLFIAVVVVVVVAVVVLPPLPVIYHIFK
jgi:hypothetical protein